MTTIEPWLMNTVVGVMSTLIATAIIGATVWAAKSYSRFVAMEGHLASIAEVSHKARRDTRRQGQTLRNHEGRITSLETRKEA